MSNVFEFGHRLIAGGFWDSVVGWFSSVLIWVGDILVTLIFSIFKFVLCIVDLMQILVERLVGIDFWGKPGSSLDDIANSDIIFKFIYSDAVQSAFRSMIVVAIVLLIVFSIIAIIKSEYDVAANGNSKASSKVPIMRTALKSLLTVFLIPILLVMGVLASNAILTGIVNALNVNNDLTLGSQIFSVSAYSANRYRVYATTGDRYAASTKVNYAYAGNEAKGFDPGVYVIDTFMEKINPRDYDADNPFEGLMYKVGGEWYLHKITAKDSDIALFGDNVALKRDVYEAFFKDSDDGFGASDVETIPASAGNLKKMGSDVRQVKAAYNTWKFATRFEESQRFDDATDLGTRATFEAVSGKIYSNVIYPKNSESWGKYFDGGVKSYNNLAVNGTDSVQTYDYAPIVDEYYVMADVVDFMASNNLSVSYANISDPRIDWAYYGSDVYLDNFIGSTAGPNGAINRVLVDYSSMGRVGYTANLSASSEDAGALYIMCIRVGGALVPIVHGVDLDKGAATTVFRSSHLNPSYNGLIVARGVLNGGTGDNNYGYPTIITSSYTSGDKKAISLEAPYYVHTTSSGSVYSGLSVHYDYEFDVNPWYATLKTDRDGSGNVVHGDYVLKEYNAMLGKENYDLVDGELQQKGTLSTSNLLRRVAKALPTSMKVYLFSGSGVQNQVQFSTIASNGGILNAEGKEVVFENIKPSAGEAEAGDLFWGLTVVGRWIKCSVYEKQSAGPATHRDIDVHVDLNFLMENNKFEYVITYDNSNIVYVVDSLDSAASALRDNVYGEPAGGNGTPVFNDGFSYDDSNPEENKFIYSKKTGFVIKDSLKFAESVDEAFADNIDGSRIKNQTITTLTAENFNQYATVNGASYNNIVKADIKLVNLAPTFDNMVDAVYRNGVGVTKDEHFEVKGEAGDFYLVTKDLGSSEKHSVKLKIDLYESNVKYIGAMRVDDVFRYGTSNGMQAVSYDPNWITTSDVISNVYDKALGTDGRLSNANTFVSYNVWTSAFRLDKVVGYANVIISDEFGEMRVVAFGQYGNVFPNTQITTDNKTVQMVVHSGFTEKVEVEIYESIAYNFSTYNAMTFIGPSSDGTAKKVYAYDPDTVNFYDSTSAFGFDGSNMISKTLSESERKTMAGLFQKFGAITATNYTLSVENVEIVSAECVDSSIKRDSTFYHRYEVVVKIFDGPKDSELSNLITKATAFVEYEIGAVNTEPEKFQTEVDVNLIRAIIAGDHTFVTGANTYDTLPDYDSDDVGALFLNGEFRKNISFVGNQVDSGFFGITLDFYLPGLLDLGDARFKIQTGTRNKPSEIVKHVFVDGRFEVSYSMTTDIAFIGATSRPSFNTYYVPHKFNFIIYIFASIIIFNILFTSVWGLISRIYEIVVYFIVMPGVAAATVMDNGTMFGKWKKNLISKVFASYGVIIGLNLFFLLIPPLKEASKIFRDSDFVGINLDWILGEYKAEFINQLIYLMFLLVAISMLKTLPGLISKLLDAGDVYGDGKTVRENVQKTTKEAMDGAKKYVSGQWALDAGKSVSNAFTSAIYDKKNGHLGNFVPGSAIINEYLDRRKKKKNEAADGQAEAPSTPETPNAPSGFDPGGADPTPLGTPENTATPAAETQVGQVFDPNGNPLGFDGQPLAGDGEASQTDEFNISNYPDFMTNLTNNEEFNASMNEYINNEQKINKLEQTKQDLIQQGANAHVETVQNQIDELLNNQINIANSFGAIGEDGAVDTKLMNSLVEKKMAVDQKGDFIENIDKEIAAKEEKYADLMQSVNDAKGTERATLAIEASNLFAEIQQNKHEREVASGDLEKRQALLDKVRNTAVLSFIASESNTLSVQDRANKERKIKMLNSSLGNLEREEQMADVKAEKAKADYQKQMLRLSSEEITAYGGAKMTKFEAMEELYLINKINNKFPSGGPDDLNAAMDYVKSLGINATQEQVFDALTNPTNAESLRNVINQNEMKNFEAVVDRMHSSQNYLEKTRASITKNSAEKEALMQELATDNDAKKTWIENGVIAGAGEQGEQGEQGLEGENGETNVYNIESLRTELMAKNKNEESMTKKEYELFKLMQESDKAKADLDNGKFESISKKMMPEAIEKYNQKQAEKGGELILDKNSETIQKLAREEWNKTHADQKIIKEGDEGYEQAIRELFKELNPGRSIEDATKEQISELKDSYNLRMRNRETHNNVVENFIKEKKEQQAIDAWNNTEGRSNREKIDERLKISDPEKYKRAIQNALNEYDDGKGHGKAQALIAQAGGELMEELRNQEMTDLAAQITAERNKDGRSRRQKSYNKHTEALEANKQGLGIIQDELESIRNAKTDDATTKSITDRISAEDRDKYRDVYNKKMGDKYAFGRLSDEEKRAVLRAEKQADLESKEQELQAKIKQEQDLVNYGKFNTKAQKAVQKARGSQDKINEQLAKTDGFQNWNHFDRLKYLQNNTDEKTRQRYADIVKRRMGKDKWDALSADQKSTLLIAQERTLLQKQKKAIEEGIAGGGKTRVGKTKVKLADATVANLAGIELKLVTSRANERAKVKAKAEKQQVKEQKATAKAEARDQKQQAKEQKATAKVEAKAEKKATAYKEKQDAVKNASQAYKDAIKGGDKKAIKKAEDEYNKSVKELHKAMDSKSEKAISKYKKQLETATASGNAELVKDLEGKIASETKKIEKRAEKFASKSYLDPIMSKKQVSAKKVQKQETQSRAKASGTGAHVRADQAIKKGQAKISDNRQAVADRQFKAEVETIVKKHMSSDEIAKALGKKQSSGVKNIRITPQEMRELSEVVKNKLSSQLQSLAAHGGSSKTLEETQKAMIKKIKAEIKKMQDAEKRRADMMAKFGVKKDNKTGGSKKDDGEKKSSFKKADTQY